MPPARCAARDTHVSKSTAQECETPLRRVLVKCELIGGPPPITYQKACRSWPFCVCDRVISGNLRDLSQPIVPAPDCVRPAGRMGLLPSPIPAPFYAGMDCQMAGILSTPASDTTGGPLPGKLKYGPERHPVRRAARILSEIGGGAIQLAAPKIPNHAAVSAGATIAAVRSLTTIRLRPARLAS
jgi:hypothetical protein